MAQSYAIRYARVVPSRRSSPPRKRPQAAALLLVTTTSTQDSDLLDVLVPTFEDQEDLRVKTVAIGTGQTLAMAQS